MIEETNDNQLSYIQNILKKEFHISYERDAFSKEFTYVVENQIVGIIIYSLIYDRIELNYIYVDKLHRNNGIAGKLMLHMINDGITNNVKNITLEVNINNKEAISLYTKYGFEIVATRKNYYNGQDGYLMIRE